MCVPRARGWLPWSAGERDLGAKQLRLKERNFQGPCVDRAFASGIFDIICSPVGAQERGRLPSSTYRLYAYSVLVQLSLWSAISVVIAKNMVGSTTPLLAGQKPHHYHPGSGERLKLGRELASYTLGAPQQVLCLWAVIWNAAGDDKHTTRTIVGPEEWQGKVRLQFTSGGTYSHILAHSKP